MTCGPIKFLLVDDLEENLFALKALLKRDGLAFDTASNGEDALELLLVEDNPSLAKAMQAGLEATGQVRVVYATAAGEDAVEWSLAAGAR